MIRHIVLWRLKSQEARDFETIRSALVGQLGRIPGLLRVEVGRSFATGRRAADLALVCDFEGREALAAYHLHHAHMETRAVVDPLAVEHWIADYEVRLPEPHQHAEGEEVQQQGEQRAQPPDW